MTLKIADARAFAKQHGYQGVIIIGVCDEGDVVRGVSYGTDRRKCAAMGKWLDGIIGQVSDYMTRGEFAP